MIRCTLVLGLLVSCKSPPPPPAATPIQAAPAAPAQRGIYTSDLDRTVDPCSDFFEYANGTWRAQNPIPPSMQRWSRRWAAGEANKDQLKVILDEVAAKHDWPHGSTEQIVGDFYTACMNEKAADAQGVTPIAPLLAEIDAIKAPKDLQRAIEHLGAISVYAPFALHGMQDAHEPTQVIADVSPSGLGLPDRDYYLKPEPRFVEARAKYRAHMTAMFKLAGRTEPAATLDAVVALETAFAKATLDNVAQRDPKNHDHKMAVTALGKLAPHVDWMTLFDNAHVGHGDLNVDEPAFVTAVDHALATTNLATWKAYLIWQVLRSAAPSLSTPLVTEAFDFEEAYLGGAKEQKPRWKQCAEVADQLFGEALGKKYVEKYFPPAAKARVRAMVDNILLAMADTIHDLTWMSAATKQRALDKIHTFNVKVGYPDKWKDYSHVEVTPGALWSDVVAGRAFNVDDDLATIGKPVDRGRWGMTPPTSNAYYDAQLNEIVFPAGILIPPAFDLAATDAVNYGAIGVVIGHEISHGFDDQGAQYDAQGKLENWWTPDDLKEFTKRGQCVVDQFDGYFIEPNIHHNGKLVLGESIGDLGGARLGWRALQKALAGKSAPTLDGFTPEQQFFIAWGQFRGDAIRPEAQRLMVQGDPHPIGKYRVIGPLSNLADFARVWSCKPDAPMVRPAATRCEVW